MCRRVVCSFLGVGYVFLCLCLQQLATTNPGEFSMEIEFWVHHRKSVWGGISMSLQISIPHSLPRSSRRLHISKNFPLTPSLGVLAVSRPHFEGFPSHSLPRSSCGLPISKNFPLTNLIFRSLSMRIRNVRDQITTQTGPLLLS